MEPDLLTLTGVSKHFAGATVLDDVDFDLRSGEVHALLGENGAGKSTLIKILAGVYRRDAGQILLRGRAVAIGELPIAFIHQDLGLAGTLTVAENIALVIGYPKRLRLINWDAVNSRAAEILADLGAEIDPCCNVDELSAAERAIVAIARAVHLDRPIIVLDEPTAALPEHEVARLLEVISSVRQKGVGVIYVSHRLDEVFRIADRVTVLRDGRKVGTSKVTDITRDDLVNQITGHSLEDFSAAQADPSAAPILTVREVVAGGAGPASFEVRPGEIVGLVGIRGAGQGQIARGIFGAVRRAGGEVMVGRSAVPPSNVRAAVKLGMGFVSSNRGEESIASMLSVRENVFPSGLLLERDKSWICLPGRERADGSSVLKRFSVRPPDPDKLIDNLSGGNQQKVILARWLTFPGRILILDEPTFGVDVGSRQEIYAALRDATQEGMGVLLVSSDMEEVANVCSRALVMQSGRITAEVSREELSAERLTALTVAD